MCWMRTARSAATSTCRWWSSSRSSGKQDIAEVRNLIEKHLLHTGSDRARSVLAAWNESVRKFVKVTPRDYKRMLACIDRARSEGLTGDAALMAAFEANARDLSRVGGN